MLAAPPAGSARHPRYGGTLRVEIGEAISTSDLAAPAAGPWGASAQSTIGALIYDRNNADSFPGTAGAGPFRIAAFEPGKRLTLAANEDYPGGRPFLDSIDIQMGRSGKDRLLDLELNKADLAEIPPEEARRAAERGVRVSASNNDQLIAIVFGNSPNGRTAAEDARVREALSESIDRSSIVDFILQREGEPAGGLLPQWSSGTAFLFSIIPNLSGAKEQWAGIGGPPKIVLGYDAADGLEQAIAERIAVNAHEAGISLKLLPLSELRLRLWQSRRATCAHRAGIAAAPRSPGGNYQGAGADGGNRRSNVAHRRRQQIYERERAIVGDHRIVPLAWIPHVYGLSGRVRDWQPPAAGDTWPLSDVWLDITIEMR